MKRFGPGLLVGGLFYCAYALATGGFLAPGLIVVSAVMVFSSPVFARASNALDDYGTKQVGSVLVGRFCRIGFQWLVNGALIGALLLTGVLSTAGLAGLGGLLWASLFATIASQGFQHIGVHLASSGIGKPDLNVLLALASSLLLNAFALVGTPILQLLLMALGYGLTVIGLLTALLVDVRRRSIKPDVTA